MHVGMSELLLEQNDVAGARRQLDASRDLGDEGALAQNPYRSLAALARIQETEADLDGAIASLDEAERRYASDYYPDVRPIAAMRARLWITQGRLEPAQAWARQRGLAADDPLSYLREFDHVSLARLLLAQGSAATRDLLDLLERLLVAADSGGRGRSVIEILVLQALVHQARGDIRGAALVPLERALTLAEPEGFVRIFLDEGPAMTTLLAAAARAGVARDQVGRLLTGASGPATPPGRSSQPLVEPLSERELDVLRLLGTELSGPEIASTLVVSLHTVRSHTKAIYAKLGVNTRRAAVRRAAELELLAR